MTTLYLNGWDREKVMQAIREGNKGYRSTNERGTECMYRSEDGNRCIVGCFIPDDRYSPSMEYSSSFSVISGYDLKNVMPMEIERMESLQMFHDDEIERDLEGEDFYKAIEKELIEWEKVYA